MQRRRLLQLMCAAAGSLPLSGARATMSPLFRAEVPALGTTAVLSVVADTAEEAKVQLRALADELLRLEAILTLYDPNAPLAILNRTGALAAPPAELVELLQLCRRLHAATDGAFDPTVQPLYAALAAHFARAEAPPPSALLAAARERIGFARLRLQPHRIELEAGMALTLNGIAQGFVADRLVALARTLGLDAALLDTGELAALGAPKGLGFWAVDVRPGAGQAMRWRLGEQALAVSYAGATRFDRSGLWNHLLDPRTGRCARPERSAVVVAGSAALADGLATALCLLPPAQGLDLLRQFAVERALIIDAEGRPHRYRA